MTSNRLLFNMMIEDIKKRIWSMSLAALIFFFAFPVLVILMIQHARLEEAALIHGEYAYSWDPKMHFLEEFVRYCSEINPLLIFALTFMAMVAACSGFSYLYSAKKTSFYHSLPVSRLTIFTAVSINGAALILVPYFIFSMTAAAAAFAYTASPQAIGSALWGFVLNSIYFLLCYTTALVAVMLTGKALVSLLGTIVFYSYGPFVSLLITGMCSTFFDTYSTEFYDYEKEIMGLSPLTRGIENFIDGSISKYLISILICIVLLALSCWIYMRRGSEASGHAMAFKIIKAPIRILLVIPLSLAGGRIFGITGEGFGWEIFGIICSALIVHCLMEIIYNADFRKLFSNKLQLIACAAAAIIILIGFKLDVIGYDRYLPSVSSLNSAAFRGAMLESDYNIIYHEDRHYRNMEYTDKETILALAALGVNTDYNEADYNYEHYYNINVLFKLKGGRTAARNYRIKKEEARPYLDKIFASREFKEGMYPVFKMKADEIKAVSVEESEGVSAYYNEPQKERIEELLSVYREEFIGLSADERRSVMPVHTVRFLTDDRYMDDSEDSWRYYVDREPAYPVYPSFKKTIELLRSWGVTDFDSLKPTHIDISHINYTSRDYETELYDSDETKEIMIYESDEIDEIFKNSFITGLEYGAEYIESEDYEVYGGEYDYDEAYYFEDIGYQIYVELDYNAFDNLKAFPEKQLFYNNSLHSDYRELGVYTYRRKFKKGELPDFIKKELKL